jgi:hypothetical protein
MSDQLGNPAGQAPMYILTCLPQAYCACAQTGKHAPGKQAVYVCFVLRFACLHAHNILWQRPGKDSTVTGKALINKCKHRAV